MVQGTTVVFVFVAFLGEMTNYHNHYGNEIVMADLYFCDPSDVVSPFKLVGDDPTVVSPGAVEIRLSEGAELVFAPCTETTTVPGCGTLGLFV